MTDPTDELIEQVIVDAYGPDDQLSSFRQWFEDTATFPFPAHLVGVEIEVTGVDYEGDDHRGLSATCRRAGEDHTVTLLDIVPGQPIAPDTRELLDAYRRWAGAKPLR